MAGLEWTLNEDGVGGWAEASGSLSVVRQTVLFSDFEAPINGNSFVPVHSFVAGDIILKVGYVCVETFNDSGSLAFQMTDADNGQAVASLASEGVAVPGSNLGMLALDVGLANVNDNTAAVWDTGQNASPSPPMGLATAPWTVGISDNERMNRDGTAGKFSVVVVYIPA